MRESISEDYREAMSIAGLEGQEFYDWIQTFKPDYKERVLLESNGCREFDLVYTDGDGGVMVFSNYSDIFADRGITMSVVGGYCDISFEQIKDIIDYMEDEMERMVQALDDAHKRGVFS
jgi:hypothetical protein